MPIKVKKHGLSSSSSKSTIAVDPSLPSYEQHPFFQEKLKQAKTFIKEFGLPKSTKTKK